MLQTLKEYTKWIFGWFLIIFLISQFINLIQDVSTYGRDSTDEQGWFTNRSGAGLIIDYKTGCQYLEGNLGGITPRLTSTGKHYGCINYIEK